MEKLTEQPQTGKKKETKELTQTDTDEGEIWDLLGGPASVFMIAAHRRKIFWKLWDFLNYLYMW